MVKEKKNKSIFKTYFIYFVCLVCFLFVRVGYLEGWLFSSFEGDAVDIAATIVIQVGIMFLLPLLLYCLFLKVKPKQVFKTCNYFKINFSAILICLIIGLLVFFANIILSTMFSGIISMFGYRQPFYYGEEAVYTNATFIIRIFTIAIMPALFEEFLHRGILLQGTKHIGFKKAILISGLMFGLIHFNINQAFYAIILGFFLGFIAVVSKNIWTAVIIHFVNNMLTVYLEFAVYKKLPGQNFYAYIDSYFQNSTFFKVFLTVFILIAVIIALLTLLIYLLYKFSILKNVEHAINNAYNKIDKYKKNTPIRLNENEEVRYLLETTTTLNLNIEDMKSPVDMVLPKQPDKYTSTFKDKIFLTASIVLGVLVTLFTFIWGLF